MSDILPFKFKEKLPDDYMKCSCHPEYCVHYNGRVWIDPDFKKRKQLMVDQILEYEKNPLYINAKAVSKIFHEFDVKHRYDPNDRYVIVYGDELKKYRVGVSTYFPEYYYYIIDVINYVKSVDSVKRKGKYEEFLKSL